MLDLNDPLWKTFAGAYGHPYDASIALKQLEASSHIDNETAVWNELNEELLHQGDVNLASYYVIPQLVRIAKQKQQINWQLLGLLTTIEIERVNGTNPALPESLEEDYFEALSAIPLLLTYKNKSGWDNTFFAVAIAALAAAKGRTGIARILTEFEDEELVNEFASYLEQQRR